MPNEIAKSSVIRLENSADISRCRTGGTSPVLKLSTVGSDSSSLTPGSSMPIVAGKKRFPTISWASRSTEWNERYREPWQARAPKTDRHENSPQVLSRERVRTANGRQVHVDCGGARAWRSSRPVRSASGLRLPAKIRAGIGAAGLRKRTAADRRQWLRRCDQPRRTRSNLRCHAASWRSRLPASSGDDAISEQIDPMIERDR